jgi:hypothetical protein
LIEDLEFISAQGLMQVVLQGMPYLNFAIQAGLTEAVGSVSVSLGTTQSQIRVSQKYVNIRSVSRNECNTDAGAGKHFTKAQDVWLTKRLCNTRGQFIGILRPAYAGLDDGKFVRADPCNGIRQTGAGAKSLCGNLQQLVSD